MLEPENYFGNNQKILDKILREFAEATGLPTILVDTRGDELTYGYGFTPFCQLMRNNEKTRQLCQNCDMFGGRRAVQAKQSQPYICHAGLIDFSYPIKLDEQVVGYILCGQAKVDDTSEFQPILNEQTDWHKDPILSAAYANLPTVKPSKIKSGAELLKIIINNYLSNIVNGTFEVDAPAPVPAKIKAKIGPAPADHKQQVAKIDFSITKQHHTKHATQSVKPEIKKALDYINKHLNEVISLDEVAEHVFLSSYYLSKLFKREMQINFVDYVNNKKIDRARILLQDSTWSVDSIAHSLGFSQTSYFSKTFKKAVGASPSQYRKQIQTH
ncbi:PocR ligand-binding domain-containing protein [Loigolactobacillus jiayinensis]|uniref:PocR ligand-binding domain-containing protein n=1 Tax=Loigolactobacillus jiayinensis TaxID=2486016 RepID=A0ABW1RAI0_9LACO|nr:PocR ligand-binding domain-containing protein [Loigolactobacillus jiayinensis]